MRQATTTGATKLPQIELDIRRRAFAPAPELTLSQWSDRYRVVSEPSPEPGRWRTERTPYLREIMDACSDPRVERVVVKKSAQVGWTEVLNNIIGYHIDQQPASILMLQPSVDAAKNWSKERLAPMLRDTPRLRDRVKESGRRDSKNTLQLKVFAGGYLAVVGSNSAVGLRSRPIRILLGDEVDAYGISAKASRREGDPLSLAMKRTQNFWNRKILEGSTPTITNASRIDEDFKLSDQRHFYVPCPHCNHCQTLKWANLRWENGDASTVCYTCGDIDRETGELTAGCGKPIGEERKTWMVSRGEWRAHRPGRPIRGYFIWAAYSLFTTWPKLVQEWLDAQGNPLLLQTFVNTALGETWNEGGEQLEPQALSARREHYSSDDTIDCPDAVIALTAGTDVHPDRLEVSVWGWGLEDQSWLVRHEVLWGDPSVGEVWTRLDAIRRRPWRGLNGLNLNIRAMFVDTGYMTDQVYRYCTPRRREGVYCTKGVPGPGKAPAGLPSKVNKGRTLLVPLGVDSIKDVLYARLKLTSPQPGYIHFPFVEEEYFRQLVAESVITTYFNKRPIRRYQKHYERNEALDCAVMAYGAAAFLNLRDLLPQLLAARPKAPPPPPAPSPTTAITRPPRTGGWIRNW